MHTTDSYSIPLIHHPCKQQVLPQYYLQRTSALPACPERRNPVSETRQKSKMGNTQYDNYVHDMHMFIKDDSHYIDIQYLGVVPLVSEHGPGDSGRGKPHSRQ